MRAISTIILCLGALGSAAPALAAGDANRGARLYEENCTGCHSLDANRVGPKHRGVYGRKSGAVPDFDYSDALKKAAVVWDDRTLDRWLAGPMDFVKGSTMPFRINTPAVREDIIAFLKRESGK
jgi:cytochrome c